MYYTFLILQALFYVLALSGLLFGKQKLPSVLAFPYCFCLANAAALAGFFKWLLRLQSVRWTHADRGQPIDPNIKLASHNRRSYHCTSDESSPGYAVGRTTDGASQAEPNCGREGGRCCSWEDSHR